MYGYRFGYWRGEADQIDIEQRGCIENLLSALELSVTKVEQYESSFWSSLSNKYRSITIKRLNAGNTKKM